MTVLTAKSNTTKKASVIVAADGPPVHQVLVDGYGAEFEVDRPCTLTKIEPVNIGIPVDANLWTAVWKNDGSMYTPGIEIIPPGARWFDYNLPLIPGQTYVYVMIYQHNYTGEGAVDGGQSWVIGSKPIFTDEIAGDGFLKNPPVPLKRFGPARRNQFGSYNFPTLTIGTYYGRARFSFTYTDQLVTYTPSPLVVGIGVAQFNLTLPEAWRIPDMTNWEIQYQISSDNVRWSEWSYLAVPPANQITYAHTNVDPKRYYRYRYRVTQRAVISPWSDVADAGQAKSSAAGGTNSVGTDELAPGSVDDTILGDRAVHPQHISNIAGELFEFPGEIKGLAVRATGAGIYFPDGTVQTTASTGAGSVRKYAVNIGAITANTAVTITHNLGTLDVWVTVFQLSNGEPVYPDVLNATTNTVQLIFNTNAATDTYRVVVFA